MNEGLPGKAALAYNKYLKKHYSDQVKFLGLQAIRAAENGRTKYIHRLTDSEEENKHLLASALRFAGWKVTEVGGAIEIWGWKI